MTNRIRTLAATSLLGASLFAFAPSASAEPCGPDDECPPPCQKDCGPTTDICAGPIAVMGGEITSLRRQLASSERTVDRQQRRLDEKNRTIKRLRDQLRSR